ncbi:MAG: hypothetical protein A4E49_02505 [Methanosaeta sp. PtaU1.Bin112]|nr:MAG: hypothetical protein A4E49_02505 [Methanosaeta sp. PtaU1.Bin112]
MTERRISLYERLPEIYRIRDETQQPPGQLKSYLALVEGVLDEIHRNIEALYHDLFIETCDDWVVPYIGDLLGVGHISGDAWTLRAEVADAISLRRRKGTLASIERLTYDLTGWGVHCVQLRENLVWNQHLNHQRPDVGGAPPYSQPSVNRFTPIFGGTVNLRDPAMLSLLGTPFDPFAHLADIKPPAWRGIRYNLPNLAIFLWRLEGYQVRATRPCWRETITISPAPSEDPDAAACIVRFDIDPLGRPVHLFNTYQFDPLRQPPLVTEIDATPGPIPAPRLTENSAAGRPEKYLSIDTYNPINTEIATRDISDVGLQLHLPATAFAGSSWPDDGSSAWTVRGADLRCWEEGLASGVKDRELVVDPVLGRLLIGISSDEQALALKDHLLVTYTYGAAGPVGAHPAARSPSLEPWDEDSRIIIVSGFDASSSSLKQAILEALDAAGPVIIEIRDSLIHVLGFDRGDGIPIHEGVPDLLLSRPLLIRAADGQRPIIKLKHPLRFGPKDAAKAAGLIVRLEGLFLTRFEDVDYEVDERMPLIARAAVDRLEIVNCTLDPGGSRQLNGTRAPSYTAMRLEESYGFDDTEAEDAFDQSPEIVIRCTISGSIRIGRGYHLKLEQTIIDAGPDSEAEFAVAGPDDPADGELACGWGSPTKVEGATVFGRMRVESISGKGGIWANSLQVRNNQVGCLKYCYFSDRGDRLPPNHACVTGSHARLHFVSEVFGEPGYGQLAHTADYRIRERGPEEDAMGAFGFLMQAHKWRNLQIRYREFMPVGVRPLLIPVT